MQPVQEWQDSFNLQTSHGISNSVDIPSFYDFSPERLRYYKNGTRVRDRNLAAEPTFTDRNEDWLLEPASGDTLELRTAERPRYVVGVDAIATLANYIPSGLATGDTVNLGIAAETTHDNAAYFELNGGSDNRVVLKRAGSEIASETFEYPEGVDETSPLVYRIDFNWYGVGSYEFKVFYTDAGHEDGEQSVNETVAELSVSDGKSTEDGNFHIFQEVDATSSNLQVAAGSFGFLTKGDVSPTERTKAARLTGLSYSGTGDYEALAAVRIDPNRANVFTQIAGIEAVPSGGTGELLAVVMPQSETDATGFSTPPAHNPQNSVIEETSSITQFTDQTGTLVTSTANPDGYQAGFFATDSQQTGTSKQRATTQARAIRPIYEDDVVVFLYKDDDSQSRTVNLVYNTTQLW